MKNFLPILFIFIFTSCSKEVPSNQLVERNSIVYEVNSQTPFSGSSISYYPNGQKELKKNFKDGELHGRYEALYESGQAQLKSNYKDGKMHGFHQTFHENGQLNYEGTLKNGKVDGPLKNFHDNGELEAEVNYKEGLILDGSYETFDASGYISLRTNYKDGKKYGLEEKYEADQLVAKTNYKDGEKHGKEIAYSSSYSSNAPYVETSWKKGVEHGWTKYFEEDGSIKSDYCYIEGDMQVNEDTLLCNKVSL